MQRRRFNHSGHPATLLSGLLYLDGSVMIWLLIGTLGVYISRDFGLTSSQKGMLVATPILGSALLRIPMEILIYGVGPKKAGIIGQLMVLLPLLWGWRFVGGFLFASFLGIFKDLTDSYSLGFFLFAGMIGYCLMALRSIEGAWRARWLYDDETLVVRTQMD